MAPRLLDVGKGLGRRLACMAHGPQLGKADDGVERRADLVAHAGQEVALGAAGLLGVGAGLLELGDVQRHDDEAGHAAFDHVGRVADLGRQAGLDVLTGTGLACQRPLHEGTGVLPPAWRQHLGDVAPEQGLGLVRPVSGQLAVDEAQDQLGIPVGHRAGHAVEHGLQTLQALGSQLQLRTQQGDLAAQGGRVVGLARQQVGWARVEGRHGTPVEQR